MSELPKDEIQRIADNVRRITSDLHTAGTQNNSRAHTISIVKDVLANVFGFQQIDDHVDTEEPGGIEWDVTAQIDDRSSIIIRVVLGTQEVPVQLGGVVPSVQGAREVRAIVITNGITWRRARLRKGKADTQPIVDSLSLDRKFGSNQELADAVYSWQRIRWPKDTQNRKDRKSAIASASTPPNPQPSYALIQQRFRQEMASWMFGSFLLFVLIALVIIFPVPTPTMAGLMRFLMASCAAFLAYFFTGILNVKARLRRVVISAGAGFGLFVLTQFVFDPFAERPSFGPIGHHEIDPDIQRSQMFLRQARIYAGPLDGRDSPEYQRALQYVSYIIGAGGSRDAEAVQELVIRNGETSAADLYAVTWVASSQEFEAIAKSQFRSFADAALRGAADPSVSAVPLELGITSINDNDRLPVAVVVDIDDVVLSSVAFTARSIVTGRRFDRQLWNTFVREAAQPAVPGALEALRRIADGGVKVIYLSNREIAQGDATIMNLRRLGFPVDEPNYDLRLRHDSEPVREYRAKQIAEIASTHRIVAMMGESLDDFGLGISGSGLAARERKVQPYDGFWGNLWFIVPNPVYGGWLTSILSEQGVDQATSTEGTHEALTKFLQSVSAERDVLHDFVDEDK